MLTCRFCSPRTLGIRVPQPISEKKTGSRRSFSRRQRIVTRCSVTSVWSFQDHSETIISCTVNITLSKCLRKQRFGLFETWPAMHFVLFGWISKNHLVQNPIGWISAKQPHESAKIGSKKTKTVQKLSEIVEMVSPCLEFGETICKVSYKCSNYINWPINCGENALLAR